MISFVCLDEINVNALQIIDVYNRITYRVMRLCLV